jgi:hypothetical protein
MSWGAIARAGRWTEWPGLPQPLDEATLTGELQLAPGARTPTMLGRRRREVVSSGAARYWVDGDDVVLVELVDPASELEPDELLAALGAPEREGAGRYRRIGVTTTEYVYPARGLALTVARSYDTPPGFAPFLAQALLFPPSDLRTFVLERGGDDRGGPRI